jgi:hypothetical protein
MSLTFSQLAGAVGRGLAVWAALAVLAPLCLCACGFGLAWLSSTGVVSLGELGSWLPIAGLEYGFFLGVFVGALIGIRVALKRLEEGRQSISLLDSGSS